MGLRPTEMMVPLCVAAAGILSLVAWLRLESAFAIPARVPGLDRPTVVGGDRSRVVEAVVAGDPVPGPGSAAAIAGEWSGFRGSNRDGLAPDTTPLARSWPAAGPAILWTVEVGEGYAGAAVHGGSVFLLDYDEARGADTLRCLSLEDGRELWHNGYPVALARNHGISRTVPALVGNCVITLGPRCHLAAWDATTGRCHWLVDLVQQHGATVPRWYTGQCPLIDNERLIVAPGGKSLVTALDYRTGQVIWESPNPRGWKMTHCSVMPMELGGQRMYVYCGSGGIAGVAADDGRLLWDSTEWPEQFATAASPLVLPDGRIFLASGYGSAVGSLMLQVSRQDDTFVSQVLYRLPPARFNAEQQTPVFRNGYLYGVRKRGGGPLVCLDLAGNELWNSGTDRFGHGPFLFVGDLLLALDNDGVLTMAEVTSQGYRRLARHEVIPQGREAWAPMALVSGRLIARDATRLVCVELSAERLEQRGSP